MSKTYTVIRNGKPVTLPPEELTPEELKSVITALKAESKGYFEKADALDGLHQVITK